MLRDHRRGVFIPDEALVNVADDPAVLALANSETLRHRYREHRTTCPDWTARPRRAAMAVTAADYARRREAQRERRLVIERAEG